MLFHVYVLHSAQYNKIYIGYSADLQSRIKSHNELATKGWTIKFRPWSFIYSESFETKRLAILREKELKSAKGREFIRKNLLKQ